MTTTGDLLLGNRYREARAAEDRAWKARRRARLKVALLAALFLAVSVAGWRWAGPVTLVTTTFGGGVEDLTDGRSYSAGDGPSMVPYRAGARFRIPLVVGAKASGVTITGLRVVTHGSDTVRNAGAVARSTPGCCIVTDMVPLGSAPMHETGAGGVLVGIDVELCCAPPPPGYQARLTEVRISYKHHGVPYWTTAKLTWRQQVVITA